MSEERYSTESLLCYAYGMLQQAATEQSRKGAKPGTAKEWLLGNFTLAEIGKRVDELKKMETKK